MAGAFITIFKDVVYFYVLLLEKFHTLFSLEPIWQKDDYIRRACFLIFQSVISFLNCLFPIQWIYFVPNNVR